MMNYHGIDIAEDKLAELCRKWKVAELSLFGSILRDERTRTEPSRHTLPMSFRMRSVIMFSSARSLSLRSSSAASTSDGRVPFIGSVWIILGNVQNKPLITDLGFVLLVFGLVLTTVGLARWVRDLKRKRNT